MARSRREDRGAGSRWRRWWSRLPVVALLVGPLVGLLGYVLLMRSQLPSQATSAPLVSVPSRAFTDPLLVTLQDPSGVGEIRYTLDDSEPTADSPLYDESIFVTETTQLAAKTFNGNGVPSQTVRRSYVQVDRAVAEFRSTIPILLIDTLDEPIQRHRHRRAEPLPYIRSLFHVIEPDGNGVAAVTAPAHVSCRAGVKARGSSTLGREKASLRVELRDASDEDLDMPLLGLPAEADWVLLGPFEFDRALIRNPLVYELTRETGRYAPRTRFVELFLNEHGGPFRGPVPEGSHYYGLYVLVEKIKRGADRVPVEKLVVEDTEPAAVSGGYVLKVDRAGPGDMGFYAGGREIHHVYPKEDRISPAQATWIEEEVGALQTALHSSDFSDPELGYARYLDTPSAIDYHIINEFTKNPDSYVYSMYFHKRQDGKFILGPVWDFDRTMGCDADRRSRNPYGQSEYCFDFWYWRLFQDPEFKRRYSERWRELRQGPFDFERLVARIDAMAQEIEDVAERNTARWGAEIGLRAGGWRTEIEQLKRWIEQRLVWFDRTFASDTPVNPVPRHSGRRRRGWR